MRLPSSPMRSHAGSRRTSPVDEPTRHTSRPRRRDAGPGTGVLGPAEIVSAMLVFRDALGVHQATLNRLNVYPVPDGDTGTNMALTMDPWCARSPSTTAADGEAGAAADGRRLRGHRPRLADGGAGQLRGHPLPAAARDRDDLRAARRCRRGATWPRRSAPGAVRPARPCSARWRGRSSPSPPRPPRRARGGRRRRADLVGVLDAARDRRRRGAVARRPSCSPVLAAGRRRRRRRRRLRPALDALLNVVGLPPDAGRARAARRGRPARRRRGPRGAAGSVSRRRAASGPACATR